LETNYARDTGSYALDLGGAAGSNLRLCNNRRGNNEHYQTNDCPMDSCSLLRISVAPGSLWINRFGVEMVAASFLRFSTDVFFLRRGCNVADAA
jgi:hypothetical protein